MRQYGFRDIEDVVGQHDDQVMRRIGPLREGFRKCLPDVRFDVPDDAADDIEKQGHFPRIRAPAGREAQGRQRLGKPVLVGNLAGCRDPLQLPPAVCFHPLNPDTT